jgi:hypothetical protein
MRFVDFFTKEMKGSVWFLPACLRRLAHQQLLPVALTEVEKLGGFVGGWRHCTRLLAGNLHGLDQRSRGCRDIIMYVPRCSLDARNEKIIVTPE